MLVVADRPLVDAPVAAMMTDRISLPPRSWSITPGGALALDAPLVMGILNATPDSLFQMPTIDHTSMAQAMMSDTTPNQSAWRAAVRSGVNFRTVIDSALNRAFCAAELLWRVLLPTTMWM